ncbi:MAG: triple tyrosine motif-containing protein, partial [Halioglobus sp.]
NQYSKAEGLQGDDFNFGASHKDSTGRLYFGGSNGYNRFDPKKIDIRSPPPPVVLTRLNIAGREPRLPVDLQSLELVELAHEDYFITIIFSALDFLDPSKNKYSYKLEGFDPEWIDNDNRNSATYTNLPAGEYTFRVRGANSAGVWNLEGASLKLRVFPSIWMSQWAFLGYALLLAVLVYFAMKAYEKRAVLRKATIMSESIRHAAEQVNDELQEQLEIQDQLVRSVYLHNVETLDLLKSFNTIQSSFSDDEAIEEALDRNLERVRAIRQLENSVCVHGDSVVADLKKYTDLIISQVLKSAIISAESITTVNEVSNRMVPIEIATPLAILIFELLHNAIHHACDEERSLNFVQVTLDLVSSPASGERDLILTVRDNGLGIPEGVSKLGTDSAGLAIVNHAVELLGAQLDISNQGGTTVSLILHNAPELILPYTGLQEFTAGA